MSDKTLGKSVIHITILHMYMGEGWQMMKHQRFQVLNLQQGSEALEIGSFFHNFMSFFLNPGNCTKKRLSS